MNDIASVFGLKPVTPKNWSKAIPLPCADPTLLYGVELEVERTRENEWVVPGMKGEADGSLRNNGWEYITMPMTYSNMMHCLQSFFNKSGVTQEVNYSERCSVHVHANCLDLSVTQLTTVLLLYQTFERVLFNWIGNDRDKNIFCVPWSETQLNYGIIGRMEKGKLDNVRTWQKYTALNILPLQTQGTIEFRHMEGNCDLNRIGRWANFIGCLFAYARNHTTEETKKEIVELNTNSFYRMFMDRVFREWTPFLMADGFETALEDGVLALKYSLMDDKFVIPRQKGKAQAVHDVDNAMLAQINARRNIPQVRPNWLDDAIANIDAAVPPRFRVDDGAVPPDIAHARAVMDRVERREDEIHAIAQQHDVAYDVAEQLYRGDDVQDEERNEEGAL